MPKLRRKPNKRTLPCYRKRLLLTHDSPSGVLFDKLTVEQVMHYARVSRSTAYRWVSGKSVIPLPYSELLKIKVFGLLPDPAFSEYRLIDGSICTSNGASFPINALDHFNMVYQQNRELLRALNQPRIEKEISPLEIAYLDSLA